VCDAHAAHDERQVVHAHPFKQIRDLRLVRDVRAKPYRRSACSAKRAREREPQPVARLRDIDR
jgi:hypothetical protein